MVPILRRCPSKMRTFSISTAVGGTAGSAATATVAANAQAKVKNVRGVFGIFTTVSPRDLRTKRLLLADRRMAGEKKLPEGPAAYRIARGRRNLSVRSGAPENKTAPEGPSRFDPMVAGATTDRSNSVGPNTFCRGFRKLSALVRSCAIRMQVGAHMGPLRAAHDQEWAATPPPRCAAHRALLRRA